MRYLTPLVLSCLLLAAPFASAAWNEENADPTNRGQLATRAPNDLSGMETIQLDERVITQIIEGPAALAVAGTLEGRVAAFDARGGMAWAVDVGGPMRTAPVWTGTHIVALPEADAAVALDPMGRERWQVAIDNTRDAALVRIASPVQHTSGDVIIADLAGTVQRVDDATGEVVWTADLGGDLAVEATPAVTPDGDVIAAGFVPGQGNKGTLFRLDGGTGDEIWSKDLGAQVVGAPTITGDRVLVPLRDGDALEARDLADGGRDWSVPFDDHVTSSPSLSSGLAIVGDISGLVQAIRVEDGSVKWTFNARDRLENLGGGGGILTVADSSATDGDRRVWVPYWNAEVPPFPPEDSRQSPFYLLDANTGQVEDRVQLPKAAHGPALHSTGVWVGNDDGDLRRWALTSVLGVHALVEGEDVTLLVNTDASGSWSVDWGTERDQGDGKVPLVHRQTLAPGEHTIEVQTLAGARTLQVTIQDEDSEDPVPEADEEDVSQHDPDPPTDGDQATGDAGDGQEDGGTDDAPLGPWVVLAALGLAAAWRRRR